VVHQTNLALPKINSNSDPNELQDLFEQMHNTLDPFYKELFGAFEDPKGILLFRCVAYL